MFLIPKCENIEVDGFSYNNRVINMNNIITFGKSDAKPKNTSVQFHTIKFSSVKSDTAEWFFDSKEERDRVYDNITLNTSVVKC